MIPTSKASNIVLSILFSLVYVSEVTLWATLELHKLERYSLAHIYNLSIILSITSS